MSAPTEVCFYSESDAVGGAERAMFRLIAALPPEAWSARLMLPAGPALDEMRALAAAQGVPVTVVEATPLGLAGALTARALAGRVRALAPPVFHAHLSQPLAAKWALAAAWAARVPAVVATVHLTPFVVDRSSALQLRLLSRGVGAYIAVSDAVAADLTEQIGLPAAKIEVIRNWVDPQPLLQADGAGVRAALHRRQERLSPAPPATPAYAPLALTPARLHEQKGLDVLLAAAATVPGVRFVIAGDGPDRMALEHQADTLGLLGTGAVTFLGPRDDIPDLLAACDLVVLPSRYEGTSLAVLEAMAARRPIVSTAIPGTLEQLRDGCEALLVPPGDAVALAAAIRRIVEEPELAEGLAGAAQDRALTEFSPARLTGATAAVYTRLLDGR